VAEYDAAPEGQKAGLLRREGLYSSHVIEWRRALNAGSLVSSTARRQQKARARAEADAAELAKLRRENARLRAELDKTREALVVTGKVHALLGTLSESTH
jgi:transposase